MGNSKSTLFTTLTLFVEQKKKILSRVMFFKYDISWIPCFCLCISWYRKVTNISSANLPGNWILLFQLYFISSCWFVGEVILMQTLSIILLCMYTAYGCMHTFQKTDTSVDMSWLREEGCLVPFRVRFGALCNSIKKCFWSRTRAEQW